VLSTICGVTDQAEVLILTIFWGKASEYAFRIMEAPRRDSIITAYNVFWAFDVEFMASRHELRNREGKAVVGVLEGDSWY
jgi:hypothetical protein